MLRFNYRQFGVYAEPVRDLVKRIERSTDRKVGAANKRPTRKSTRARAREDLEKVSGRERRKYPRKSATVQLEGGNVVRVKCHRGMKKKTLTAGLFAQVVEANGDDVLLRFPEPVEHNGKTAKEHRLPRSYVHKVL